MITPLPINEPHIAAFRLSGTLSESDCHAFETELETVLSEEKKVCILIQLEDFEDGSAQHAWNTLSANLELREDILRIAFVGEESWRKWLGELSSLFRRIPMHYFSDEAEALAWLKEVQVIASADEFTGYRHLLVASDFSVYSEQALKKAIQIAQTFDAKITLFHAADILSSEIYPEMGELSIPVMVDNPELKRKQLERLEKHLKKLSEKTLSPTGMVNCVVKEGYPVDAIREFSLQNGVDLIIMGSHGRRGLAKLLGSSTNGVINHAPCDVLVTASRA